MGTVDLPQEELKVLANRIEEIITGQTTFHPPSPHIEDLAQHYARLLRRKEMTGIPPQAAQTPDWERVNLNTMAMGESRTIGGEAIAWWAFRELGLERLLSDLGLSKEKVDQAALLIIGRLLYPASERETAYWGRHLSGLEELLGADYQRMSHNALYRLSDKLVDLKETIESFLSKRERDLFDLEEKIILYDLTNTYFEGRPDRSTSARRGFSKEKRSDCPLVTLALVLDEDGFPKASRVFPGNVSEPSTLGTILDHLKAERSGLKPAPTVIMDAGIATKENLDLIRRAGYHHISVSRSRPKEIPLEGLLVIREDGEEKVAVKKLTEDGETVLYCQSTGRRKKEEAIKSRLQKHFEEGLTAIAASLGKKRGIKAYDKVMARLGRLQEKYPTINQFYQVKVAHKDGVAQSVTWEIKDDIKLQARFSGAYYLRSDRNDLDEKKLWSLYVMLTGVEDAFRSMKTELGLRPIYHQKDERIEAHLFITVLAYHLLNTIQRALKLKGIRLRWQTIRSRMATQARVTGSITNDRKQRIHIRLTTEAEPFHHQIYRALGLPTKPLGMVKKKM
jgi:transposase